MPKFTMEPRVFVFGGKAAPGYHLAKLIIRLITAAAEIINRDPGVRDLIKVVYLPNFNVTNGQRLRQQAKKEKNSALPSDWPCHATRCGANHVTIKIGT